MDKDFKELFESWEALKVVRWLPTEMGYDDDSVEQEVIRKLVTKLQFKLINDYPEKFFKYCKKECPYDFVCYDCECTLCYSLEDRENVGNRMDDDEMKAFEAFKLLATALNPILNSDRKTKETETLILKAMGKILGTFGYVIKTIKKDNPDMAELFDLIEKNY